MYPPEILPLAFRVKGVSLSTATNWVFNFLVGESTPVLQDTIHWRLYLIHAGFCLLSFALGQSRTRQWVSADGVSVPYVSRDDGR